MSPFMRPLRWTAVVLCATGMVFVAGRAGGEESSAAEAEGAIFERQQIMLQLERDTETLGQIVAGELPPDKLATTARAIADGAKDALASFQEKIPGGHAKPEVWSNWEDYSRRMESFARNADQMAKIAQGGNVMAVTSVMGEALPCKQCHDLYREKKK